MTYDLDTKSTGSNNLATSLWIIDSPTVSNPPDLGIIKAELMIWIETTPQDFVPGGTKRGEITMDDSSQNPNKWIYICIPFIRYQQNQSVIMR